MLLLVLGGVMLVPRFGAASEADDKYLQIYQLIEKADRARQRGEINSAKEQYAEADRSLRDLKQRYPGWNTKLIAARQNHVLTQLAELNRPAVGGGDPNTGTEPNVTTRVDAGPMVKLLSPGFAPGQTYRLQATTGAEQTVKVSVQMKMSLSAQERPGEVVELPVMQLRSRVRTQAPSSVPDFTVTAQIEGIEVLGSDASPTPMATALEAQLKLLQGTVITGRVTDRYYSRQAEAKLPSGGVPVARENLDQIKGVLGNTGLILPEEAIGVGAKWEVRTREKENGIMTDLVSTHELIAVAAGRLEIKSQTIKRAAAQKIPHPLQPGSRVDLTELTGLTTEELILDLTKAVPIQKQTQEKTEVTMGLTVAGRKQSMVMKTETTSTLQTE